MIVFAKLFCFVFFSLGATGCRLSLYCTPKILSENYPWELLALDTVRRSHTYLLVDDVLFSQPKMSPRWHNMSWYIRSDHPRLFLIIQWTVLTRVCIPFTSHSDIIYTSVFLVLITPIFETNDLLSHLIALYVQKYYFCFDACFAFVYF